MLSEDPLGALTNGVGPSGSGGGPGNQIVLHHNVQEQEALQQNSKPTAAPSRYESQKRRDWNTFGQYLKNHRPPLALPSCTGSHVLEFLRYLDQFGKTKVHIPSCHFFGMPNPPPCPCPLQQAWGSLDALIGRLRAAFEENGGKPESNPFGARMVRLFLRDVKEMQSKARGIPFEKRKRKRPLPTAGATSNEQQLQLVQQQHHPLPQGHSQTNPLTGHGYAQHSHQHKQHSQQHSQHSQQHSQHTQHTQAHSQHSQHSQHNQAHSQHSQQHSQHSHSPVSHPLNSYAPNSNPLLPFSQQHHTSNLLHNYAPSSNTLNPYLQPNPLNAYQDLQLHNHSAGPLLS